jgi:hypothetical protein
MLLEISGPFFVQGNAIGVAVLSAIDLDHEPLLMAREICKITTYGRLAPEMRISTETCRRCHHSFFSAIVISRRSVRARGTLVSRFRG